MILIQFYDGAQNVWHSAFVENGDSVGIPPIATSLDVTFIGVMAEWGTKMVPIEITITEVAGLIAELQTARHEVLVSVDPIDKAFKVKIDGGIWSPPMGKVH